MKGRDSDRRIFIEKKKAWGILGAEKKATGKVKI